MNFTPYSFFKKLELNKNLVLIAIKNHKFKYLFVILLGACTNFFELIFLFDLPKFLEVLFFTNDNSFYYGLKKILTIFGWGLSTWSFKYLNHTVCAMIARDLSRLVINFS